MFLRRRNKKSGGIGGCRTARRLGPSECSAWRRGVVVRAADRPDAPGPRRQPPRLRSGITPTSVTFASSARAVLAPGGIVVGLKRQAQADQKVVGRRIAGALGKFPAACRGGVFHRQKRSGTRTGVSPQGGSVVGEPDRVIPRAGPVAYA